MLIAEDAKDTLQHLQELFDPDYEVVSACNGEEAFRIVRHTDYFDISIVDIVMPIESKKMRMKEGRDTGIRLIEEMIDKKKTHRILVFTVRGEIEDRMPGIVGSSVQWRFLDKKRWYGNDDKMRTTVRELMALPLSNEKAVYGALHAEYRAVLQALQDDELGRDAMCTSLGQLDHQLGNLNPALDLTTDRILGLIAHIYVTLDIWPAEFPEDDLRRVTASRVKSHLGDILRDAELFK